MYLTDEDTAYLTNQAQNRRRARRIVPMILVTDIVLGGAAFLFVESPANLFVAGALVASGVMAAVLLSRATAGGPGGAQAILDGRQPTDWLTLVALGSEGVAPRAWSFEIPSRPGWYVHAAEPTDHRFEAGQEYTLYGFGEPGQEFADVVYFSRPHDQHRIWDRNVVFSEQRWNTTPPV